ncbi:MAG: hypothetical protein AVDCRST_MAG19-1217, partial [uncultured Thermomicrobiales bacterium]
WSTCSRCPGAPTPRTPRSPDPSRSVHRSPRTMTIGA